MPNPTKIAAHAIAQFSALYFKTSEGCKDPSWYKVPSHEVQKDEPLTSNELLIFTLATICLQDNAPTAEMACPYANEGSICCFQTLSATLSAAKKP